MFQLRLFDDIVFFEYFLNAFKSSVDLFDCVCRHKAETNQSVLRRNGRRHNRVYKYAIFKKVASYCKCLVVVADEERNDRSRSVTNLTTDVSESIQCIVCNLPQVFDSFRLAFHNIEGCVYSGCRRWCDAGAEDVRSRVVAEVVCSHRVCRDEASKSGNDLLKVPIIKSTSFVTPKWSHVPRP